MRSVILSVCILAASFLLVGCPPFIGGPCCAPPPHDTLVGNITGLFMAEEEVDISFYSSSSSGFEVKTATTKFSAIYKQWWTPPGENVPSPPSTGRLVGHWVQNQGNIPLYIFFEVFTEEINGPQFIPLPNTAHLSFSDLLDAYRLECPDLNDCKYVIIVPPGESRMFRYGDE